MEKPVFVPPSPRVNWTTSGSLGSHHRGSLPAEAEAAKFLVDMEEDQLKFLKQRARLMHMRMAQIYEPTQKRREEISNLTMEMEGSTWHAIKQLEAENKTLKATQQLQSHAPDSPRSRSPRKPTSTSSRGARELAVETSLQLQVQKLQEENARLRAGTE